MFCSKINAACWVCLLSVLLNAEPAYAERRLAWQDQWRRVGAVDYVSTGVMGVGALVVSEWVPPAADPAWARPILFDWPSRSWLSLGTASGRHSAELASDVLLTASMLQPLLVDTLVVAAWRDRNPDVAHQMGVVSLQAYALTQLLNVSAKRLFARRRPYVVGCEENSEYSPHCDSIDQFRSYYSGHAAFAAAGAGLVCSHHTHLPLYGGGNIDTLACGAAAGVALTTGVLRILADRHWATDVLTGYVIGFSTGYLLPTLLYYRSFRSAPMAPESQSQQAAFKASMPLQLGFSSSF